MGGDGDAGNSHRTIWEPHAEAPAGLERIPAAATAGGLTTTNTTTTIGTGPSGAHQQALVPTEMNSEANEDNDGGDDDAAVQMEDQEQNNDIDMHFVGSLEANQDIGSLEPSIDDFVSELLLNEMGASGRSYRREGRQAARKIVT